MKLIHCADLHLDSKMNAHLDSKKAKERKTELLHTFSRMVEYADDIGVKAILIAGDLFDTHKVSATATSIVLNVIEKNKNLDFYYLQGNHDNNSFIADLEEIPENLKLFTNEWTYYRLDSLEADKTVCIAGIQAGDASPALLCNRLQLEKEEINIVMMHGQEEACGNKEESIPLKELKNRNIDYLALGHIHSYRKGELDARGIYCYSGCLEGRGFDECGECGFVVLDINEKTGEVKTSFVPFAGRKMLEVELNTEGCANTLQLEDKIREILTEREIESKHLVRILLTGERDCETDWNLDFLQKQFSEMFYYFAIKDATNLKVDYEAFTNDVSLKGEFVRTVMKDTQLSEEEKAMVVRCGICALKGEDF